MASSGARSTLRKVDWEHGLHGVNHWYATVAALQIRSEDKERLRKLGRVQYHYQITPEVVRELNNSLARGQAPIGGGGGHSKVGVHVVENVANLPPVLVKEEA